MYKLAIITVNFNNLEGLKKTMESVLNQSWQDFEYLVIDGGSTDGSREYIESQQEKIKYWVSEIDRGVYHAMNKGIEKAKGEYLLFLNSGDHFYSPEVLEQNYKQLKDKDLIYFNLEVIDKDHNYFRVYPDNLSFSYLSKDTLPHPATFISRNAFKNAGKYDEGLMIVSDWKFFIEGICKYNLTYTKVEAILSTFYLGGMSALPENKAVILSERTQVLKTQFSVFIDEAVELDALRNTVRNLKKSKKINWLIKLGLIDKF
jgi:glycosyltransferase involved in cell wall biosynthesis